MSVYCLFYITEPSSNAETPANGSTATGQSISATTDSWEDVIKKGQNHQVRSLTETDGAAQTSKLKGIKAAGKGAQLNFTKSVRAHSAKGAEVTEQVTPVSLFLRNPKPLGDTSSSTAHDGDVSCSNVTFRKHTREMYLMGKEAGKDNQCLTPRVAVEPFLIEEAPVRDDSQSDWSLSSNGSTFTNNIHLTSYPSKSAELVRPFPPMNPSVDDLDFGSSIGENSDETVYKEIVKKPSYVKPKPCVGGRTTKSREPIPGSEGEKIHRLCPKSLFSELKMSQQDSGFDSPQYLIPK